MKIGITGTREELTGKQRSWLRDQLAQVVDADRRTGGITELHHGDCVGADEAAHAIARTFDIPVVIHPPDSPRLRAWCDDSEAAVGVWVEEPKPYLERNHDIVDATDMLLVLPLAPESIRSGTWSTYRYAVSLGRLTLVGPYGA